jgi:hypothetical protein
VLNFFSLPQNSCCLEKDSYVGLDEFFELTTAELLATHFSGEISKNSWCTSRNPY